MAPTKDTYHRKGRKTVSLDGPRDRDCKVQMTDALYIMVEDFINEERGSAFKSRNDLIEIALRFYIDRYQQSKGLVDQDGFPLPRSTSDPPPFGSKQKKHA